MPRFRKVLKKWWAVVFALLITLLTLLFAASAELAERIYARFLYPIITAIVSPIFASLPFSFTEVALVLLALAFLVSLLLVLTRKLRIRQWLYYSISVCCFLYGWFYLSWGFNYFRQPLAERLNLEEASIDVQRFREMVDLMVSETNRAQLPMEPIDMVALDAEIERCFRLVADQLQLDIPAGLRRPKSLFFNSALTKTLTSGFYSPFFHEIHLNNELLPLEIPHTLAHEKAHQMGIAGEAEANFLAYLVCLASSDSLVQYSGQFQILGRFLSRSRFLYQDYDKIVARVAVPVREDFRLVSARWRRHAGAISELSSQAYDRYLKANRIQDGVANYSGVVDLVIRWQESGRHLSFREND